MAFGRRQLLSYRYYNATMGLIIVNVAVFLLQFASRGLVRELALIPPEAISGRWWTLLTYMFVHSTGSLYHIIFNMLGLMWFGAPVEREIGSDEFLALYLISGVAAGLFAMVLSIQVPVAIIGASGALFAVMITFATLFPEAVIYAWFVPMRAPVAVLIFAGIAVIGTMTGFAPGISHLTHLGGLVAGFLYVWLRIGRNPLDAFFRRR